MRERFRDIITISAVVAVAACGAIALMNGAFVEVWTSGKISWNPWNNLLLGCVLFSTAVTRCHTSLVGVTKQIRGMKYVNLLEGAAFVLASLLLVPTFGLAGLLVSSLICNLGIAGIYGVHRTADYFKIPKREVILWVTRPVAVLGFVALAFYAVQWSGLESYRALTRLWIEALVFATIIPPCLWVFGLNSRLRREIGSTLKRIFTQVTQRRSPA
jgi:O-antigen/teichoic acid export membrane protein